MKYLKLIVNYGNFFGFVLMVLGFFLIPFLIGIPIMIAGILLLVFNFYKKWVEIIVPEKTRNKIKEEIVESYEPYKPALNSIKTVGKDMLKIAGIAFVVLVVIAFLVLRIGN